MCTDKMSHEMKGNNHLLAYVRFFLRVTDNKRPENNYFLSLSRHLVVWRYYLM